MRVPKTATFMMMDGEGGNAVELGLYGEARRRAQQREPIYGRGPRRADGLIHIR